MEEGCKIEHFDIAKNDSGKLTNHELSIGSNLKEIIVVIFEIIE